MKRKILSTPSNYFFFSAVGIVLFYFFFPEMNLIKLSWNFMGLVLMIFGMYLIPASYQIFKKYKTTEKFEKSEYLVTEGIYKHSRNPMYLGAVIFLFGLSIMLGNVFSFVFPVVFFILMNWMFIPYEEEKAEKEFGKKYLDYKKKVRKWF